MSIEFSQAMRLATAVCMLHGPECTIIILNSQIITTITSPKIQV